MKRLIFVVALFSLLTVGCTVGGVAGPPGADGKSGATGSDGQTGASGATGVTGTASSQVVIGTAQSTTGNSNPVGTLTPVATAQCPTGKVLLGGGGYVTDDGTTTASVDPAHGETQALDRGSAAPA